MNKVSEFSELVQPTHINTAGTLFGGYMLSWLDLAAAKAASEFLEETDAWGSVTRALDKVEFKEPVYLGDWVKCKSTIIATGNTSVKVQVKAAQIANEGVSAEYERGSRTTLDVIQSNALLLSAQISLASSEKNYLMAQYNLLKAVGLLNSQYLKLK